MTQMKHSPLPWKVGRGKFTAVHDSNDFLKADIIEADCAFVVHAVNNIERLEAENLALKAQLQAALDALERASR